MKLEIKLIDEKESALKNAELTFTLVLKNGSKRVLPSRTSNVRGEIPAFTLKPNMFKAINFAKSRYQITVGDRSTPELKLGQPAKVSAKHFRYILMAHKLGKGEPSTPPTRAVTQLRAILETEEGKRLAGSNASLTFSSKDGISHKLGPVAADKEGIAHFQLPVTAKNINWSSLKFYAEIEDLTFTSIKTGVPDQSGEAWIISAVMQRKKKPQPKPEPPTDPEVPNNEGWSTGPEDSGWVVQGVVTGEGDQPQSNTQVKAYDKSIGNLFTLGRATTTGNGRYRIYYKLADEKKKPNLLVKVFKGNKQLATSGLIAKAGPTERVDFSLSEETFAGVPLYTQLFDDTEPFIKGKSPTLLDVEDVALLADETNHNSIVLAHYVRAWDLIESLKQPSKYSGLAEPFFALTAGGLHPTLEGVLGTGNDRIRSLLDEAIESRWISQLDVDAVIQQIEELRSVFYKDADSDLSKLLDAVGVAKTKKGEVISVTLGEGEEEEKWDKIESIIGAAKSNKLRDLIAVWRTLEKDATLTIYLFEKRAVTNIAALMVVEKDSLLEAVQNGNEMPAEIQGKNNKEKQVNYADALFDLIEERNPHQHFLQNLVQSKVDTAKHRAQQLLAHPELDLEDAASLRALAADEGMADLADLATLYVICPLPGRADHAEQLMAKNILSSMDVIEWTKEKFRSAMLPEMKEITSNAIYDKAAHLGSMTTALSIQLPENDPDRKTTLVGQLFSGALSENCEHCVSTFSPSAYLLDLYRFLKRAEYGNETSVELLNERRPDIKDLELNCHNSDTLLPYIDLSNEVLEAMVTSQPLIAEQTTWEPERLRAEPQHVNPVAYEQLATQTFPWNMGYDRELKRSKAYLAHLGVDLAQLSHAVTVNRSNADSVNLEFARTFGMTNPQAITYGAQSKWLANWGVSNRSLLEQRPDSNGGERKLGDLSRWLHLEAIQIVNLCNTKFVDTPSGTFDSLGNFNWSALDDDVLRRLQFLGRLYLQTGYSVELLDRIFELDTFDANSPLVWRKELSALEQLSTLTQLSVEQLVAVWELDTADMRRTLAEELGLTEAMYVKLAEVSQVTDDTPSGLLHIARLVAELDEQGLNLEDSVNLLGIPQSDHLFSSESNSELLVKLKTTIAAVSNEGSGDSTGDRDGDGQDDAMEVENGLSPAALTVTQVLAGSWAVSESSINQTSQYFDTVLDRIVASIEQDDQLLVNDLSRMSKFTWIVNQLEISETDLSSILAMHSSMRWMDLRNLPVEETDAPASLAAMIDLAEHQRVNQAYFMPEKSLFAAFSGAGDSVEALIEAVSLSDGLWSRSNVEYLLGPEGFNFTSKSNFINKSGFSACSRILETVQSTGGTVQQVWAALSEHDASQAQALLQLGISETEYWEALQQLNDPIREACRQRLTETVLTQSRNKGRKTGFENTHDLYEHILIDPEMSACFETSRTKQAIASLQQLIQRTMLNLEEGCSFNSQDIEQWAWRKNYRVWEANRKVFLTPENWVEPELRDNKSELFLELETELLQGEVDSERAEKTLLNYARGLLSLSRMEMVAALHDTDANRNYVFARTSDHPRKYYWCLRDSNGLWGGWESIEQEIEGDHILPVIFQNRIFLFWLNLAEKVNISHQKYQESLAEVEADEEICRAEINEKNRLIQDYTDKEAEFRAYAEENYGAFAGVSMTVMWNQLADNMKVNKGIVEEQLQELKVDLVSLKSQKDALARAYTYFECNLSWSQYDRLTGWSAARRSVEGVNTIYVREDDENDTHLRNVNSFWITAKPNDIENDLDIELRTSAGNADGKSYDYRLGLFEFDPVLEQITAKDESSAPKFERDVYFTTIWHRGQKLAALHVLPYLKIDVDNQDQTLVSWDRDIGASAYPERINGYNPSYSPFLFGFKNRSYFFEPIDKSVSKPLLDISSVPKVPALSNISEPKVTNTNFQALSPSHTVQTVDATVSPAFANGGLRKAATPLGRSDGKLADGRPSGEISLNTVPATPNDWKGVEAVMQPTLAPATQAAGKLATGQKWNVSVLYHPFADIIVSELYRDGIDALYKPDSGSGNVNANRLMRQGFQRGLFNTELKPTRFVVLSDEKEERFEFNRRYPYSVYNWEVFFHAPFAIAKQLTRNRKYEDAQQWLHYIFDPISKDRDTNRSSWRFKPFYDEHLRLLDGSQDEITEFAEQNYGEFEAQVAEWEQNPFNPHAIARLRTISYMRATFIAYVDNLLAWADDLFRRDTMESVAEAAQLYIHAAQILGPAPVSVPDEALPSDSRTLSEHDEGKEQVHPLLVASGISLPAAKPGQNDFYSKMGNFCIPANDRIQEYWDTVADRLFKIRYCMNIEGVERTLALFQPPIDPAMLVKAAAAGIDIGSVVAGIHAPLPNYRFTYILQKAKEFAGEVRSLGNALLSALEKQDAEELSQLRSSHELGMQKRILEIKKERFKESQASHASLERSIFAAMERRDYYLSLIDQGSLGQEKDEVKKLEGANKLNTVADGITAIASVLSMFPQTGFSGPFPKLDTGGLNWGTSFKASSDVISLRAGGLNRVAGMLARDASNVRRSTDWEFEVAQAKRDIDRLEKDQLASEIRMALAEKEIADQEQQIANSEEADLFLRDKFTNTQLYGWMASQLSALHYQAYQLALDMAKQAEACMNFELDSDPASIIEFTYWDGMKKGLLSGERLIHDLNRLDAHYIANNDRKLELTKNVSLLRIDAGKLLDLKRNSECEFTIPEYIFDLDYPGHYNRRIKSVALTIPAITGPYTAMSSEMSIKQSWIVSSIDQRAEDSKMPANSVALSSGQNDSGLFQFDLKDERYLPFEGHGVQSTWKIAVPPKSIAQFDYSTISDVILTFHYTAKNDPAKRTDQIENLSSIDFGVSEFTQLLSIKAHFPDLWSQLASQQLDEESSNASVNLVFSPHNFPYLVSHRGLTIVSCDLYAQYQDGSIDMNGVATGISQVTLSGDNVVATVTDQTAIDLLQQTEQQLKDIHLLIGYTVNRAI